MPRILTLNLVLCESFDEASQLDAMADRLAGMMKDGGPPIVFPGPDACEIVSHLPLSGWLRLFCDDPFTRQVLGEVDKASGNKATMGQVLVLLQCLTASGDSKPHRTVFVGRNDDNVPSIIDLTAIAGPGNGSQNLN